MACARYLKPHVHSNKPGNSLSFKNVLSILLCTHTCLSELKFFFITNHPHRQFKCVPFSSPATSFTKTTIRFPCQPLQGDDSGTLVWKLRKCVITEGVGGERRSVSGGMPKGRNKWVAELYIKKSALVFTVQAHSDSLTFAPISEAEGLERGRKDLPSSAKHSEPSVRIS